MSRRLASLAHFLPLHPIVALARLLLSRAVAAMGAIQLERVCLLPLVGHVWAESVPRGGMVWPAVYTFGWREAGRSVIEAPRALARDCGGG